eukprot:2316006-Pyramimonas_sp.AAC.1
MQDNHLDYVAAFILKGNPPVRTHAFFKAAKSDPYRTFQFSASSKDPLAAVDAAIARYHSARSKAMASSSASSDVDAAASAVTTGSGGGAGG